MNDSEKLSMLKTLLGIESTDTSEDARLAVYLSASEKEIVAWRYSYSKAENPVTVVPPEYEMTQLYAVIAGYSQSGAENQLSHSENGISRAFKYEDMIAYVRTHVIPICGVV